MSKITNFTKVRVTTEEQCQGGRWVAHACLHVAWAEQVIEKLPNAGSSPDRFVSGHKPSGPDVGLRYIGRSSARMLCALDFNRGEFDGIVTELESVDSMFGTKAPTCAAGGDWQCHPS